MNKTKLNTNDITEDNNIENKYFIKYLSKIDEDELKFICKRIKIKEISKNKIIENLVKRKFDYGTYYKIYMENYDVNEIKQICRYFNLNVYKQRAKDIEELINNDICLYKIEDMIKKNKKYKYMYICKGYYEDSSDKSKTNPMDDYRNEPHAFFDNENLFYLGDEEYDDMYGKNDDGMYTDDVYCDECQSKHTHERYYNLFCE